ncbi:MAG: hypothetical protein ABW063_03855 [Caulobacter sp.]
MLQDAAEVLSMPPERNGDRYRKIILELRRSAGSFEARFEDYVRTEVYRRALSTRLSRAS